MLAKWFGNRTFWKASLRLALPIAFQNLLTSSFALVDTIMVGSLGDVPLAAVGMAGQWSWLLNIVMFGFTSGASVFIAQYWGRRQMEGIHHTYGLALSGASVIALLFTAVGFAAPEWVIRCFSPDPVVIELGAEYLRYACWSYVGIAINQVACTALRSTEEVKLPMYISMVSVAANAFFNAVFIYGLLGAPAMGVRGAALATAISSWISPILLYAISWARKNILRVPVSRMFGFSWAFVRQYVVVSLPVLLNESIWAGGTVCYNMIFGHMGTQHYSALTVFRSIEGLTFVFFVGLCHACAVQVGKSVGHGDYDQATADGRRYALIIPLLSVAVGLVMIALRPVLLLPFNVAPEVAETAKTIILIYGLELGLRNIPYSMIVGIFRAGGDTRIGLMCDILTVWLMALPLTFLCGIVWHVPFVWTYLVMLLTEDIVKVAICLVRFRSRRWIRPVSDLS